MTRLHRWPIFLSVGLLSLFLCGLVESKSPFYPDKKNLLVLRDDAGKETPIKNAKDWAKRREHIVQNMEQVMGPLPDRKTRVDPAVKVLEEKQEDGYLRRKITFAVARDERVTAYLLTPTAPRRGKLPAVLCLHQTNGKVGGKGPAGPGDWPGRFYGVPLVQRGYVTLAPDYPSFGEYDFDFKKSPFQSGSMKAIWNNLIAVDVLVALPEVDAGRVGVIGHSLGGHNAMFTAVFDPRLRAIV